MTEDAEFVDEIDDEDIDEAADEEFDEDPDASDEDDDSDEDSSNDPVANLQTRLDSVVADLGDPKALRSEIGRIRAIQSELDKLTKRAPDPRLALIDILVNELAGSDALSEDAADAIAAYREGVKDEERIAKYRKELGLDKAEDSDKGVDRAEWVAVEQYLNGVMEAKGIDPKDPRFDTVYDTDYATPKEGRAAVMAVIAEIEAEEKSVKRVAERKANAGKKPPGREGTGTERIYTIDQLREIAKKDPTFKSIPREVLDKSLAAGKRKS